MLSSLLLTSYDVRFFSSKIVRLNGYFSLGKLSINLGVVLGYFFTFQALPQRLGAYTLVCKILIDNNSLSEIEIFLISGFIVPPQA